MSKINNLKLLCICCGTGISILIYTASVIFQWILFAHENTDGVGCLTGVALASAVLSSLATLVKCVSASYSACLAVNHTTCRTATRCTCILTLLQTLLRYAALGCTAYLASSRKDHCGTNADTGDHQELPPLIIAVASLESISSLICGVETVIKIYHVCYKCHQRKKMKRAGEYEPLNNKGEAEQQYSSKKLLHHST